MAENLVLVLDVVVATTSVVLDSNNVLIAIAFKHDKMCFHVPEVLK